MNKDDLFVALVFLGHTSNWPMAGLVGLLFYSLILLGK